MRIFMTAVVLLAQAATPIFRFETDGFWLNLHHFLYVLGRVEAKMPDIKREAVAGASADEAEGSKTLSEADRQAWRNAVTAYATGFSKRDLVFDREAYVTTNALRRVSEKSSLNELQIDATVVQALETAAPIYRRAWWPRHRDANRNWLQALQDPL